MKKEFVSIKWSQIPDNQWVLIVLTNPKECINMVIPRKGAYVVYQAYFPLLTKKRMFNIIFPLSKFEKAIYAIPPILRNTDSPVQFEFKKNKRTIFIQNWKII
jgi:hypothetical protein